MYHEMTEEEKIEFKNNLTEQFNRAKLRRLERIRIGIIIFSFAPIVFGILAAITFALDYSGLPFVIFCSIFFFGSIFILSAKPRKLLKQINEHLENFLIEMSNGKMDYKEYKKYKKYLTGQL